MEPENKTKEDCGCADGNCCPPKKNNSWSKIIFIVVIVAALMIVIMKLTVDKDQTPTCSTVVKGENGVGTDTTAKPCCADPNASCGDKTKK